MWWNLKKPTFLFKCWLRNRNFTQNTLDTRCQIKSLMWPHKIWWFRGGVNRKDDLPLKSPSTIYPKSSVWFTPPNCQGRFTPQIAKYNLPPPPNHPILSKISDTQHHALLHKGLFCERPKNEVKINYLSVDGKQLKLTFLLSWYIFHWQFNSKIRCITDQ